MVLRGIYLTTLPIVTGILLAFAMPPADATWLVWIALVPLGLAITEEKAQLELYLGVLAAGLVFQWMHCDWMRTLTSGATLSYGRVGQWIAQGIALSVPWVPMFWLSRMVVRRTALPMTFLLPLLWVSFEFVRWHFSWVYDQTGFPWGQVGLVLADHLRLAQVASLAGVYGVSAIVAIVNGLVVDCLRRRCRWQEMLVAFGSLALCLGYGHWQLAYVPAEGPTICLMPVGDEAADAPADARVLLWGEAINQRIAVDQEAEIARLQEHSDALDQVIIMGCKRRDSEVTFNSTAVVVPRHKFQGFYDKIKLVPFSEFHPSHLPAAEKDKSNRYRHGCVFPVYEFEGVRIAPLICYDICFPDVVRRFMGTSDAPGFFAVSSFEGHDPSGCIQEGTLRHTRFRAIESRRSIVRNVEGGFSCLVDGSGRLVSTFDSITAPTAVGAIPMDDRFSPYAVLGDWLPFTSLGAIVVLCWRGSGRTRPRRSTLPTQ